MQITKIIPKIFGEYLKSLDMPPKGGRQSKILLKENGVVSFDSKKNANFFVGFSETQQTYCYKNSYEQKIKYVIKATREYYNQIRNVCEDFVLYNV